MCMQSAMPCLTQAAAQPVRTCEHHLAGHIVLSVEVVQRLCVEALGRVGGADQRPGKASCPCHLMQALWQSSTQPGHAWCMHWAVALLPIC